MKIFVTCMECQKELGIPSFEPIFADYYEQAVVYIECSRGHKSAVLLQSQKFEILLESAANALIEGYTLEAASSLSAAYERFLEFAINVFCEKNSIFKENFKKTFNQVSHQSERQIGGFLFLYLVTLGESYTFNTKITEYRNKIIHKGFIPTPEEVISFGELIYEEIYSITQSLKSNMANELHQVIMNDLVARNEKIPADVPRATSTGTMFFSLSMAEQKQSFNEAFASYKEAKNLIASSVPYMKLLNRAVSVCANLKSKF